MIRQPPRPPPFPSTTLFRSRSVPPWLLPDLSPSMAFGTADRLKVDVAEGVANAVGRLATRRGNRLGVMTFGGPEPRVLPPRQGRAGLHGAIEAAKQFAAPELHPTTPVDRKSTRLNSSHANSSYAALF